MGNITFTIKIRLPVVYRVNMYINMPKVADIKKDVKRAWPWLESHR